jgi:hypothetical protein
METYEGGGHAYHTTMPTDALTVTARRDAGDPRLRLRQAARRSSRTGPRCAPAGSLGFPSVAAPASRRPAWWSATPTTPACPVGKAFLALGLQTAAGVPLQCDEPADFKTFRIGLFGLEKLHHVDRTVALAEEQVPVNRLVELDHAWQALNAQHLEPATQQQFATLLAQITDTTRERGEMALRIKRWSVDARQALVDMQAVAREAAAGTQPRALMAPVREAAQATLAAAPESAV